MTLAQQIRDTNRVIDIHNQVVQLRANLEKQKAHNAEVVQQIKDILQGTCPTVLALEQRNARRVVATTTDK